MNQYILPDITLAINHRQVKFNLGATVTVTVFMSVIYLLINQRSHITTHPNYLFQLEYNLPFVQELIWGYLLALMMAIAVPIMIVKKTLFIRVFVANLITFFINLSVWLIYPVAYPRQNYSDTNIGASGYLYELLINIDSTLNSLPSGHASLLFIVFWIAVSVTQRIWRYFIYFFIILGLISIILVKQHSIVDVIAGILSASLGVYLGHYLLLYSRNKASD